MFRQIVNRLVQNIHLILFVPTENRKYRKIYRFLVVPGRIKT